ncbi:MAG: ADP-glyceromanno-heptose 6-epimerase [Desulfobacterales bacterium]|nr:ADP-glyceromanno-heptose 6-epimerase [Desulfobacterales bacterium]MDD4071195.1 ADP-glyceromanno-heptose 6-epimerase [Desulfobacterales bacterium]MDD4392203.1 ADP-glyceromanno-heptose 6-epimerase [Desulfobacterales bacterium]
MYIVTGGAGFIGSAFIWKLNQSGINDILVVDNLAQSEKWKNLVNRQYKDYIHKTVFIEQLLRENFTGIEAIVHLGACSSTTERDADFLMENNFHFSRTLARYAIERKIRFINASSAATYGAGEKGFSDDEALIPALRPLNMYGYSKQLFDLWLLRENLSNKVASLKFFNVYGPNEYHKADMCSVIYKSFFQVKDTGRISLFKSYRPEYPDGGQLRDFVYVKDCVEVIMWLVQHPEINGIFNVGTGKSRTWKDLALAVFDAMGVAQQIDYIEMPQHLKDRYQYFTQANMEKLSAAGCPVQFTSLEEGTHDYITRYLNESDPCL